MQTLTASALHATDPELATLVDAEAARREDGEVLDRIAAEVRDLAAAFPPPSP